jgi:hypothetical protein
VAVTWRRLQELEDFQSELVKRGYVFHTDAFYWEHPNGAIMSFEAVRDLEQIWGRIMVERCLSFLEAHNHERGFNVTVSEVDPQEFGISLKIKAVPNSLLEVIAIASAD